MNIYLHTLYSLVAILKEQPKRKRRRGMMTNKKKYGRNGLSVGGGE
jgi:hypothetical protein